MLTAEQLIKREILLNAVALGNELEHKGDVDDSQIDEIYANEELQDLEEEFRSGQHETDIPAEWSRHYESKSVARQLACGQWVGWTYWYGGGKHGCPEEIEWMEHAYLLNCVESQQMVTVREFSKVESDPVTSSSAPAP